MHIGGLAREFVLKRIPKQTSEWISRGMTLFSILSLAIIFGSLALIPSIISSIQEGKWISLLSLSGAYATIWILLFKKNLSYYTRSYVLCLSIVVVGYISISSIGLVSSARLWFLCAAVLACLLIDGKSAFAFFVISLAIFIGFGFKTDFAVRLPAEADHTVWIITSTTFVIVSILVVGSTYLIVTGMKRAEASRRESEERFRLFAELAPVGIVISDRDDKTIYVSRKFTELFGYTLSDIPTVNDWWPLAFPDQEQRARVRKEWRAAIEEASKTGLENKPAELPVTCKDGTLRQVEYRATTISDLNVVVFSDITERKRVEEEREKLREQLAQSQKMEAIGSLAGGVAHDLNNLLSPILGYGEMLREELDTEDARRESVEEIISAGLRARDLVRQLLAFSRKQILEFKPLNLNKVAAGLERLLRRTIREDIEMKFELSPGVGVVMADIGQIEQVIINLSVNAVEAMPQGGKLTLETGKVYLDEDYAKHHEGVKPGEYTMLAVSDSGIGMDSATRERVFDPFFSTKGESGTGLGLATVYGIVKQHGGNIWVYSEPGEGSTFKVYFPVVETSVPEATTAAETSSNLKGSETILIVEDNEQVRRLAESVLKRNGYNVLTAKDGAQALERIQSHEHHINLLLTDVVLPDMNGRELYEKTAEAFPSMKVVYMSGYTNNVIAHRGVLDEGVDFIQKPFTVYGMAAKIREVLDENNRE